MSGKDTAGDKLIASIQKTKAQAASGTDAAVVENDKPAAVTTTAKAAASKKAVSEKTALKKAAAKKATAKKATAKKAAPKKAEKSKAPAAKDSARSAGSGKKPLVDLFNRGRRVWPD